MAETEVGDDEVFSRPFADWLREQAGGKSHDELSDALFDLVQKVKDTRKAGTLTYTIKVGLLKGDNDVLLIHDEIKLRPPEHDRKPSMFYTDKHGNLSRNNPDQLSFDSLREVPAGAAFVVDQETGELKEIKQ